MALPNPIVLVTLIATVVAAAAVDIRTGRIPNRITMGAAAAGLALAATGMSGTTMTQAMLGLGLGFLLLLPGHLLGGTGAGDVKLLAGVGAIVGPDRIVATFLFSTITGGVLAIAIAAHQGRLRATVNRAVGVVKSGSAGRAAIVARVDNRFPFGPAIAIGSLLSLVAVI